MLTNTLANDTHQAVADKRSTIRFDLQMVPNSEAPFWHWAAQPWKWCFDHPRGDVGNVHVATNQRVHLMLERDYDAAHRVQPGRVAVALCGRYPSDEEDRTRMAH